MTVQRTRAFAVDQACTAQLQLDRGDDGFTWDEARVVQIDNPPHEAAFDTDRFYKIPMVAARPVEQTYNTRDGQVTMKKPADELRAAAWSLDNAPVTLGHPSTRIVDSVDRVHGFVRNPEWDEDDQSLRSHAYVPVSDSEAKAWIEDNDGVSIGFWYESDPSADRVDAYQRDLLVDHVAIVDEGRCSREDGCGLAADSAEAIRGFSNVAADSCSPGPCSCGLHTDKTEAREERAEYRYETREAAANAAEELDCDDGDGVEEYTHSHEKDNGQVIYMPCKDHGTFREAFDRERGDEFTYDTFNLDDISEEQKDAIRTIRDEHKEMDSSEIVPNMSTLEEVYERGAAAWQDSHAPGASQQQWALARVKEFLKDLRNGNALNSGADNDLAPDGYSPPENDSVALDKSVDDIDLTVPDGAQSAAEAFLEAEDEGIIPDECGTGEGSESAEMIAEGEVTAERLESDIAPYLNSHEEDTSTDEHPSNWSMDEDSDTPWTDCGDAQYAAWGWHSLTDWARRKADEIKRAKGEDTVYGTDRPTEDRHWTDHAKVSLGHQMAESEVEIDMAVAPAPYYIALHDEGSEYTRQNVSVGEQLGRIGPFDAYQEIGTTTLPFDEPIAEPRRVYAVLYYASPTGDMADPIESQQGFIFDSAVVMPDDSPTSLRRSLRDHDEQSSSGHRSNAVRVGDNGIDVASLDDQLSELALDRTVAGVTFEGLRDGDLDESEIPNDGYEDHYLYPGDTKSESSYPVVDGDGMLRRGNVDAAHQLGARGGVDEDEHERNLMQLNEVFAESEEYSAPIDFETDTMTNNSASPLDVGDLTLDAVAEQHEGVAELQTKVDELETQLDAAKEEIDDLSEELESYRADEKQEIVDEILTLTDAFGDEEELMEMGIDTLESHLSAAKDIAADVAGGVGGGSEGGAATDETDGGSEYEPGEVYDLADTA